MKRGSIWARLACAWSGHDWKWIAVSEAACCRCDEVLRGGPMPPTTPFVSPRPYIARHARAPHFAPAREFIGSVVLTGIDGFGKWSFGGAEQGSDEFVITHVRFPVVPPEHRHLTLLIGKAAFQLGAMARGAGAADGWIKLTFPPQFAQSDFHVFRFSSWSSDWPALVIDVRANILRMP